LRLSDSEVIMPKPLLVGRSASKLDAISKECGGLEWTTNLDKALADCDAALKRLSNSSVTLGARGLVRLRQGEWDKSIADYDAALAQQPRSPWSLYGRGLARLRQGMTDKGKADIAAATALQPLLPQEAATHGLTP